MISEARKCPFCGAKSLAMETEVNPRTKETEYYVKCWGCNAHGPNDLTEAMAITDWNIRLPLADVRTAILNANVLGEGDYDTLQPILIALLED